MASDYDVVINGVKAKVRRDQDGGSFKRRTVRREIQNQLLSQADNPAFVSRDDQVQLFQKSWAGGARWWKPLLGPQDLTSYFQGKNMDAYSEPGKIQAQNFITATHHDLHPNVVIGTDADGKVYGVGATNDTNASFLDVYRFTGVQWERETGFHSGLKTDAYPVSMTFHDGKFYVLDIENGEITRFDPAGPGQDAAWITGAATSNGSALATIREGVILYRAASPTATIQLVEPTAPALETLFADGLVDTFSNVSLDGDEPILRRYSTLVASPEGIYYVANKSQGEQTQPWVWRVERTEVGVWIGTPIATLPVGLVALSATYHMGHILISTTSHVQAALENDADGMGHYEVTYYFVGEGGMGALGSPLGDQDALIDETPYQFVGTAGPIVYIGGHKRLWLYDSIRGGIHTAIHFKGIGDFPQADKVSADGPYSAMVTSVLAAGNPILMWVNHEGFNYQFQKPFLNFASTDGHYEIESNYFDGGLPMETKQVTKVAILRDPNTASNLRWRIDISADDGAFVNVLDHSAANQSYAEAIASISGRKFRYRVRLTMGSAEYTSLRAVLVTMNSGEMVTEWDVVLDGDELLNVDNEVQDEQKFYNDLVALAANASHITFIDNMKSQDQDASAPVNVKVIAVEISKDKPGESSIRVMLREV